MDVLHCCVQLHEARQHLETAVALAERGAGNATDADLACYQFHLGRAYWNSTNSMKVWI